MFVKKKKETTNKDLSPALGVSALETEKGTVLSDDKQGRYSQPNELGLTVAKPLRGAMGVDATAHRVVEAHDADAKTADTGMRAFLVQIRELGVAA